MEDEEPSSATTGAAVEAPGPEVAKREAISNPLPVFGDAFEPVSIAASDRKNLLGNLALSGERIAAAMALKYCAPTVAPGRAATEATLASKLRKVSIRDDAKNAAKAAGSSRVKAPASDPTTDDKIASIEKALKDLSKRLPGSKLHCPIPHSNANIIHSRKRKSLGEGDQEPFRFGETRSEKRQQRESSCEREVLGEDKQGKEREKEEGVRALKRCNFSLLFNGEDVPDTVLKVPFESLVEFFRDHMPPAECFIAPTPVFKSPEVPQVPEHVERMLSFNLKFIPHYDPSPAKVMRSFEEFKRSCRNCMYFHNNPRDPLLTPTILKKLYLPSGWEIDDDDRHTGLEIIFGRIEAYLQETLAATLATQKRPLNPAFSAVREWIIESNNLVEIKDKNLGVAIVSVRWYQEKMNNLFQSDAY